MAGVQDEFSPKENKVQNFLASGAWCRGITAVHE